MIYVFLLVAYLLPLFGMVLHTAVDCHDEEDKPFYRKNSSAGMRRLRLVLWPIAMFMP